MPTVRRNFRSLAATVLLAASLCACAAARPSLPEGAIPEAPQPSARDEERGQMILNRLSRQHAVRFEDDRLTDIERIVARLTGPTAAEAQSWPVYLFDAPDVASIGSACGNQIFVWSGIFDVVETSDERVALLATEVGHILAQHHATPKPSIMNMVVMPIGSTALSLGLTVGSQGAVAIDPTAMHHLLSEYVAPKIDDWWNGEERKREAELLALYLLAEAEYDPATLVRFWERVVADEQLRARLGDFAEDPPADERIDYLREALPRAQERYALAVGRGNEVVELP